MSIFLIILKRYGLLHNKSKRKYVLQAIAGIYDCGVYKNLLVAYNRQSIHIEAVRSNREDFKFSMCLSMLKYVWSGSIMLFGNVKKRIVASALTLALAFSAIVLPAQSVFATDAVNDADFTLTYRPRDSWGSLLADIWMRWATNSNSMVDSVISENEMYHFNPSAGNGLYGQGNGESGHGEFVGGEDDNSKQLTNYLKGLYNYQYVDTYVMTGDQSIKYHDESDGIKQGNIRSGMAGSMAGTASMSANIAKASSGIIKTLSSAVININVPSIVGIAANGSLSNEKPKTPDQKNFSDTMNEQVQKVDKDNPAKAWLDSIVEYGLNSFGLTGQNVSLVRNATLTFIIAALTMSLVFALRNSKKSKDFSKPRTWVIRLITILLTPILAVTLTAAMTEIVNKAQNTLENSFKASSSNLIVDTWSWASQSNFKLPQGVTLGTGRDDWKQFDPNKSTIIKVLSQMYGTSTDPAEQLNAITSNSSGLYNALSYSTFLANHQESDDSIQASVNTSLLNKGAQVSRSADEGTTYASWRPVFFFKNPNANAKQGTSTQQKETTINSYGFITTTDNSNNTANPSDTDNDNAQNYESDKDKKELKVSKNSSVFIDNTRQMDVMEDWKMWATQVAWNNPKSYLIGAYAGASQNETFNKPTQYNGILSNANQETFDPKTGEPNQGNSAIVGTGNEKKSNYRVNQSNANALMIALYNKYAGLTPGQTFSNQSTAFILSGSYANGQFDLDLASVGRSDAGTYVSMASQGVNGGVTGVARYSIPNSGKADLEAKISHLASTYMTMAIISIMVIFYLFTAPLFPAIWKSIVGFFKALLTGDLFGLADYAFYYLAAGLSFVFAMFAISFGLYISDVVYGLTSITFLTTEGVASAIGVGQDAVFGIGGAIDGGIALIVNILITIALSMGAIYPFIKTPYGRKVSIVGAVVLIPYLMCESALNSIYKYQSKLYPNAKGRKAIDFNSQRDSLFKGAQKAGGVAKGVAAVGVGAAIGAGAAAVVSAKHKTNQNAKNKLDNILAGGATQHDDNGVNGVTTDGKASDTDNTNILGGVGGNGRAASSRKPSKTALSKVETDGKADTTDWAQKALDTLDSTGIKKGKNRYQKLKGQILNADLDAQKKFASITDKESARNAAIMLAGGADVNKLISSVSADGKAIFTKSAAKQAGASITERPNGQTVATLPNGKKIMVDPKTEVKATVDTDKVASKVATSIKSNPAKIDRKSIKQLSNLSNTEKVRMLQQQAKMLDKIKRTSEKAGETQERIAEKQTKAINELAKAAKRLNDKRARQEKVKRVRKAYSQKAKNAVMKFDPRAVKDLASELLQEVKKIR